MRTRQAAMHGMVTITLSSFLLAGGHICGDMPVRLEKCRYCLFVASCCRGRPCTIRLRGGNSGLQGDAEALCPSPTAQQEAIGSATATTLSASADSNQDVRMQDEVGVEGNMEGGGSATEGRRDEDFWMGHPGSVRRPWGQPGENTRMDNDEALRRFKTGACVLVLNFPVEMDFGIDLRSWTVGPKFKGLKMVPAGIHLLYWDAGHGMTQGMWFHARPSQVLILRWDESIEDFAPTESPGLPPEQLERLVAAVRRYELDSGLAAYPLEDLEPWRDLTRFLDGDVLAAAGLPIGAHATSCHVVSGDPDEDAKADNTTGHMTAFFPGPARTARFSCIGSMRQAALGVFRRGQGDAAECSILQGDETDTLKLLLETAMHGRPARLLGEVQLAFVCFLLLHSMSAFEHWKLAVSSFCSARKLASERPGLMHNVVSCLQVQLARAPCDWFRDEVTQDNFLRNALLNLHRLRSDLKDALALGAKPRMEEASRHPRMAALCFRTPAGVGKGRLLVRRTDALFEFVEKHFGVGVSDWSEASELSRSGTSSRLARELERKDRSNDSKEAQGSDEEGDRFGLRVEKIAVNRHVRGIDADARFMCDDEEVGSHDEDPGPFVEYMTREIPPHRTSASAGEESGGGEPPASGGEANMGDGDLGEMEGPVARQDQVAQLMGCAVAEGQQPKVLSGGQQQAAEEVDGTTQLEAALDLIPQMRRAMDKHFSNRSDARDSSCSKSPPLSNAATGKSDAGEAPCRQVGKVVGGGGRGGIREDGRGAPASLPPDLLTDPQSVVDGNKGMVIDLRRANETKLMVAGHEPAHELVSQLQDYFERPVSVARVACAGPYEDDASQDSSSMDDGPTDRMLGAQHAAFRGDEMDGIRCFAATGGPEVPDGMPRCGERGESGHGADEVAQQRAAGSDVDVKAARAKPGKRQPASLDYSRFSSLHLSSDEAEACAERRPYDMCERCRGPRPADLEIRDEHETVLEYVCKECYHKPHRMEWMLERPDGWVDPFAPDDGSQAPDEQCPA